MGAACSGGGSSRSSVALAPPPAGGAGGGSNGGGDGGVTTPTLRGMVAVSAGSGGVDVTASMTPRLELGTSAGSRVDPRKGAATAVYPTDSLSPVTAAAMGVEPLGADPYGARLTSNERTLAVRDGDGGRLPHTMRHATTRKHPLPHTPTCRTPTASCEDSTMT